MKLVVKTFNELTTSELYEILKVRAAVFVVEQKCPYQDADGVDTESLHVFLEENGEIMAYLRAFFKNKEENVVQIGRVLTMKRGIGLGDKVLQDGIEAVKTEMKASKIYIEAQTYALGFYEKFGFKVSGEEFLEDDIPHTPMELELVFRK